MPIQEADFCQTVMQDLADIAGRNYGAMQRSPTGLLDAALSAENTNGIPEPVITDSADGKGPKTALIEFIQRSTIDDISTDPESVCEPGNERPKLRYTKAITKYVRTDNIMFSKSELRKFCEAPSTYRKKRIMAEMDALFRKINRVSIGQYLASVGGFFDGVAGPKDLQMLYTPADGGTAASDPMGEIEMMQDFQDIGWMGQPMVVGAGHLDTYTKLQGIGCCNQYGQDIGDTGHFNYFWDRDVDAVAGGSNNALAFIPGTIQFASWLENKGEFVFDHAHFAETTVVDPVTGIEVDMEMNYDRCTKKWQVQFGLHFDLFLLPLDMYKDSDDMDGVNGTLRYTTSKQGLASA